MDDAIDRLLDRPLPFLSSIEGPDLTIALAVANVVILEGINSPTNPEAVRGLAIALRGTAIALRDERRKNSRNPPSAPLNDIREDGIHEGITIRQSWEGPFPELEVRSCGKRVLVLLRRDDPPDAIGALVMAALKLIDAEQDR